MLVMSIFMHCMAKDFSKNHYWTLHLSNNDDWISIIKKKLLFSSKCFPTYKKISYSYIDLKPKRILKAYCLTNCLIQGDNLRALCSLVVTNPCLWNSH